MTIKKLYPLKSANPAPSLKQPCTFRAEALPHLPSLLPTEYSTTRPQSLTKTQPQETPLSLQPLKPKSEPLQSRTAQYPVPIPSPLSAHPLIIHPIPISFSPQPIVPSGYPYHGASLPRKSSNTSSLSSEDAAAALMQANHCVTRASFFRRSTLMRSTFIRSTSDSNALPRISALRMESTALLFPFLTGMRMKGPSVLRRVPQPKPS